MSVPVILDNIISKTKNFEKTTTFLEKTINTNLYYPQYSCLENNFDNSKSFIKDFLHDLYLYHMKLKGVAYVENFPISKEFKTQFLQTLCFLDETATLEPNFIPKCTSNDKVSMCQDFIISSSKYSGPYFEKMLNNLNLDDEFPIVKVYSLHNISMPIKRKFVVLKNGELINYVLSFFLRLLICIILIFYIFRFLLTHL